MPDTPRHMFAVPAWGESPYLADCLDSLTAQTLPGPVRVCTSTPSPGLESLCRRKGVDYRVNPLRQGLAADWTFAYQTSETDYVTLAHQDDVYHPDYAAACCRRLEGQAGLQMVFTDYAVLRGGRVMHRPASLLIKRLMLWPFYLKTQWSVSCIRRMVIRFGNPVCCPSVMYHKRRLGDWAFDAGYAFNADWDAWIRMTGLPGAWGYIRRPLMQHRIHGDSETTRLIRSGVRREEEFRCLARLMPPGLARLYLHGYALGAKANRLPEGFRE